MNIKDSVAVVTGSNRGIGHALVEQLLAHGARKVYAAARDTSKLADVVKRGEGRVVPLALDLTNAASIAAAAKAAGDANLLINNAGALEFGSQLTADVAGIRKDFETNYFGTLHMVRAFAPVLEANKASGGATIATVLSVVALASMPGIGGYSASKAAAHSLTLALRGELGKKGIQVLGIYPGPVDTDMAKEFAFAKASPQSVAIEILKGLEAGELYIMPDPMAKGFYATWSTNHRGAEKQFGGM
jgi:short-subunit dehydrogenase